MPLNLELKIKLDTFNKVEENLVSIGASFEGVLIQKDVYFKWKNGLLKLRIEKGTYILIKYARAEKGKRWSDYELLELKGKNPEKYLSSILDVEAIVEKKRKLYLFNNTRIHLDEVKGLGKFLELETLLVDGKASATKRFITIKKLLGIEDIPEIRASYKNLIMKK
jgi:adenylate cyclase, class 2